MEHSGTYFSKDKTKFSHELCQILDEVAHGRPTSSRLGKPCPYAVRSVNPLPGPELGFRLVSESDSDPFASELLFGGILRRTAQRASHYLDSLSLEYLSVCPIKIGIFSKWRKIEVVKWAEDAIYAPIQTTDDKNRSLR